MKRIVAAGLLLILVVVGVIFWMTGEERTTKSMLRYLEGKYGETFEVEYFDKGDMLFPDLYGEDKMMVHPAGNRDIPFYVFKDNEEPDGFYDLYVPSYFSYQYTEKYKQDITAMDSRELIVKFVLASANWPVEATMLQRNVDEVAGDEAYAMNIQLKVAIKLSEDVDIQRETDFLYKLYTYMKEHRAVGNSIHLSVVYVRPDGFEAASRLARLFQADNVSWIMLEEHIAYDAYFGWEDVEAPSYFEQFFE